jgi:hypothetical protein
MSEIKDGAPGALNPTGGPAFPHSVQRWNDSFGAVDGMSLRDYFAARAMQGICAHPDTWGLRIHEITEHAYDIADAMLRARSQS